MLIPRCPRCRRRWSRGYCAKCTAAILAVPTSVRVRQFVERITTP